MILYYAQLFDATRPFEAPAEVIKAHFLCITVHIVHGTDAHQHRQLPRSSSCRAYAQSLQTDKPRQLIAAEVANVVSAELSAGGHQIYRRR